MVDYMAMGKRIQRLRLQAGRTQEELAEYLDVSVGYVSRVECGQRHLNLDRLSDVAQFLNVSLPELVADMEPERDNFLRSEIDSMILRLTPTQKAILVDILQSFLNHGGK